MSDTWRDQVAAAVRSVKVIMPGGTCFVRAAMGGMALAHLGLQSRPVIGGAIFRAGPNERMDAVSFCGPSNHAEFVNGLPLFHVWLEVGGDVVDFATGDWHEDAPLIEMASTALGHSEEGLPPITWEVEPPEYVWQPAHTLAGKLGETPPLGGLWYMPGWRIPKGRRQSEAELQGYFNEASAEAFSVCKPLWPAVKEALPPPLPKPPSRAEARRQRQMQRRDGALPLPGLPGGSQLN